MPTIYSTAGSDGTMLNRQSDSWASTRDDTESTYDGRTSTRDGRAVQTAKYPARGGGSSWRVGRVFLYFDTTGITEAPESASLKIYGYGLNTADFFVVKSTHTPEFAVTDFDSILGWSNSGVDNEGNVTKYSDEITSWSASGYNTIALNSTALTDIGGEGAFLVCLIESTKDLRNVEPAQSSGDRHFTGMYFSDTSGTSNDPYLDYTVASAAATDNSVFFGCNF